MANFFRVVEGQLKILLCLITLDFKLSHLVNYMKLCLIFFLLVFFSLSSILFIDLCSSTKSPFLLHPQIHFFIKYCNITLGLLRIQLSNNLTLVISLFVSHIIHTHLCKVLSLLVSHEILFKSSIIQCLFLAFKFYSLLFLFTSILNNVDRGLPGFLFSFLASFFLLFLSIFDLSVKELLFIFLALTDFFFFLLVIFHEGLIFSF